MRHLTRLPARTGHYGRRRVVLSAVVAGILVVGGTPVAALDDGDDSLDGEVSSTSESTSEDEEDGGDSVSSSSLDETVEDTSGSVDDTSGSVDETVEDTSGSVDETVEETEQTLEETTETLTGEDGEDEEDDPEEPDEPEEPEESDDPEDDEESEESDDADEPEPREQADDDQEPSTGQAERSERRDENRRDEPEPESRDEEEDEPDDDEGDVERAEPRYLDGGPFDPPPPRAPSQLLRTGHEPFDLEVAQPLVAESRTARDTDEIMAMLRDASASESTIARLMAPFPLAGPASYGDDGTPEVRLRTTEGTPVVSAGTGTVEVTDAATGVAVELTGHDGTTYRYEGLRASTLRVADGEDVRFGQTLGNVAGLDLDGASLTFALWSPDGEQLAALPYLDRWLEEAAGAAEDMAGAAVGAFEPQVADPAADPDPPSVALDDEAVEDQSGLAPARADGQGTTVASLLGMLGASLVAYLGVRLGRSRTSLAQGEGFLDDDLDPQL